MESFAGCTLEETDDVEAWAFVARRYAELQIACAGRRDALAALGCPHRPLAALMPAIASLADDRVSLRCGAPEGITEVQLRQLRRALPALQRRCVEMEAMGAGDTLEHGDLWPGNAFVDRTGGTCAIIDWEDAAIAHPFLGLAPLMVGLGPAGLATAENVSRVERAYAEAFASLGSMTRLRATIERAAPLGLLEMAVRYRAQRGSMVALHPWMRDLVPQVVRLALERL